MLPPQDRHNRSTDSHEFFWQHENSDTAVDQSSDPERPDPEDKDALIAWQDEKIEDLEGQIANLREFAYIDPLTTMLTPRGGERMYQRLMNPDPGDRRQARAQGRREPFNTVMEIDVDEFSDYNNLDGHPFGNHVLSELGRMIRQTVRDDDHRVRSGGDEFVIVLPDTDIAGACVAAGNILTAVRTLRFINKVPKLQQVTLSIGVGRLLKGENLAAGIGEADRALRLAKEAGRNCIFLANNGKYSKYTIPAVEPVTITELPG